MLVKRRKLEIWVLVLLICFSSSGCSSYRKGVINENQENSRLHVEESVKVCPGQNAKVNLWSGKTIKGKIVYVSPTRLELIKPSNYGAAREVLEVADIKEIMVEGNSESRLIPIVIVGVTTAILAILISSASGWEDGLGSLE